MMDARLPKSVSHLAASDAKLAVLIERIGPYRMRYHPPDFHALARSIVFQQLNGRAAATIFDRLVAACGGGDLEPDTLLKLRQTSLRKAGLSPQKTAYIRDLARLTAEGKLDFKSLRRMADEEAVAALTQVKGVGVWTAHMFLMFALRRQDVLPVGDYGIRSAMKKLYGLADLPKPPEMEQIAGPWKPWRSVGSWYLWRSLDGEIIL